MPISTQKAQPILTRQHTEQTTEPDNRHWPENSAAPPPPLIQAHTAMSKLRNLLHRNLVLTRAIARSESARIIGDVVRDWSPTTAPPWRTTSFRFLDIYQFGNKEAIEKERARLKDEMSRGYFADMSELKQHGGKIAMANKILVPAAMAVKFPTLEVNSSHGGTLKLPIYSEENESKITLLCLAFRANSQSMIDSWTMPFVDKFKESGNIQLYQVSFVDSWFLSLRPIKSLLLRVMKKSNHADSKDALQRQVLYSFGDHYDFRKQLRILNLLTGYVFLLDKFSRIRWQGFGMATEEEISALLSCTSLLVEEK
ncbi:hypothetical protein AKJ16_DCAP06179 [Drosera capensis]